MEEVTFDIRKGDIITEGIRNYDIDFILVNTKKVIDTKSFSVTDTQEGSEYLYMTIAPSECSKIEKAYANGEYSDE